VRGVQVAKKRKSEPNVAKDRAATIDAASDQAADHVVEPPSGATATSDSTAREGVVIAFPTKARCPRCGSPDTKRVSASGKTQYRRCERAICRHAFKVSGREV
jgi:hypothetical protein